jgi:hypothetical protein
VLFARIERGLRAALSFRAAIDGLRRDFGGLSQRAGSWRERRLE